MSLSAFIAFVLGMTVEILLLAERTLPPENFAAFQKFRLPRLSPAQSIAAYLGAVALLLIGLFELVGLGPIRVSMSDGWVGIVFVGYGVFVFFAGIMGNLLPRVNEVSILSVQVLIAQGLWANGVTLNPWLALFFVGLPAVVMAYLVFRRTPLGDMAKAMVYLWYLFSLMALSFENGSAGYFSQLDFNLFEGFAFGSVFIFLILHGLFSIRFFLIASSLIVPRNRAFIGHLMPHLFSDEQIVPRQFVLLLGIVAAVLLLNAWLRLVPPVILLNLSVMICVQFLFRSDR